MATTLDVQVPPGSRIRGVVTFARLPSYADDGSHFRLRVATVEPTSVFASILQVGDIIKRIDGTYLPSATLDEWNKSELLNPHDTNKSRTFTLWRPPPANQESSLSTTKKKRPLKSTTQGETTKKGAVTKKQKSCSSSSSTKEEKEQQQQQQQHTNHHPLPLLNLDEMPWPGFISQNQQYYSTLNNETTTKVASKLGCSWKDLAAVEENQQRYGVLKSTSILKPSTYLRIPTEKASQFKLSKLLDQDEMFVNEISVCMECGGRENPNDPDDPEMLLCDGCDVACHVKCSDQDSVPQGEWFCAACLDILQARRARYGNQGGVSLVVHGPPKAAPLQLSKELSALVTKAKARLEPHLRAQREATTPLLEAQQEERSQKVKNQFNSLKQAKKCAEAKHATKCEACVDMTLELCNLYHVVEYGGFCPHCAYGYITLRIADDDDPDEEQELKLTAREHRGTPDWNFAVRLVRQVEEHPSLERCRRERQIAANKMDTARRAFWKVESELKGLPGRFTRALREREQAYAGMLQEPRLAFETTKAMFNSREGPPRLLGFVKVSSDADASSLVTLKEPIPLIATIPLAANDDETSSSDDYKYTEEIIVDHDYAIFARAQLFCPTHDDNLPMESHGGGVRSAQRRLMGMIDSDPRNNITAISRPQVPTSVRVRGGPDEEGKDFSKCFDLSELVRDCTCALDLPMASTPQRLAEHGLVLRDYQKSSLQFMLDKEKDASGLGFAGELWSRSLTLEGDLYYFCPLTGSFSLDIFNYKQEAEGKNARNPASVAKHCGGLPRGGVLADEMGLGKSVISIALIAANPPSKENRVLAREYKFDQTPTHPAYSVPPSVAGACCTPSQKAFLSNGTIIVAPMTLCSQWQSEIKKFAPWYTTLTIHNSEKPSVQELASVDIVIASTVAVSNKKKDNQSLISKLKRIHFHRILVDESHFQQQGGQKTCIGLSKLSATYRWGVTGTPIGSTLDDLHGQCGFLRIPGFTRESFWKNAISDPYIEHNTEALRVLRCLLSHVVVRHSKEQTVAGNAMVKLPPRTVTTEIIPFGSEHERNVYNTLEARNRLRFQELRRESVEKVLNEFVDLTGMMLGARQACSHSSAVDLYQLERLNNRILNKKDKKATKKPSRKPDAEHNGAPANTRATILARAVHWAPDSAKNRVRRVMMSFQEGEVELMECPICLEPFSETEAAITECGHPFCRECILNLFDACGSRTRDGRGRCASCRTEIGRDRVTFLGDAEDSGHAQARPHQAQAAAAAAAATVELSANVNGFSLTACDLHVSAAHDSQTPRSLWKSLTKRERLDQRACLSSLSQPFLETFEKASGSIGTKVSQLIEEVKEMMKNDPTNKAVVFSQFIGTLDCASQEMAARGIRFVRIDDSMQQHARADALHDFSTDPNCKVFLLSSRAGAQGLSLTAANWCFILDAPLNSAVEEQSIDRIHRIGQTRPVFVKRLVMENTVEERILEARRSIGADHPQAGCANIDGTSLVANEQRRAQKRDRRRDEEDIAERRFEKLATLEMLFGCSSDCHVAKA